MSPPIEFGSSVFAVLLMLVPLVVLGRMALKPPQPMLPSKVSWTLIAVVAGLASFPALDIFFKSTDVYGTDKPATAIDLALPIMAIFGLALAARVFYFMGRRNGI